MKLEIQATAHLKPHFNFWTKQVDFQLYVFSYIPTVCYENTVAEGNTFQAVK